MFSFCAIVWRFIFDVTFSTAIFIVRFAEYFFLHFLGRKTIIYFAALKKNNDELGVEAKFEIFRAGIIL